MAGSPPILVREYHRLVISVLEGHDHALRREHTPMM